MELLRQSPHQGSQSSHRQRGLRAVHDSAGRDCIRSVRPYSSQRCFPAPLTTNSTSHSSMLAKAGERMPLACTSLSPYVTPTYRDERGPLTAHLSDRYKKMVYDFLANCCGRAFAAQLPETSYHKARFPSPAETSYDAAAAAASYMNHIYSPETYASHAAPSTAGAVMQ